MSKVITFSRQFPAHHPKKGQPTLFVEKILNSILIIGGSIYTKDTPISFLESLSSDFFHSKKHTIRAGNRWKAGDYFSPRVWSDKPYQSKQIVFAPDIKIMRVATIEIKDWNNIIIDGKIIDAVQVEYLAKNDGLAYMDMVSWLNKLPFSGQLIIWDDNNLPY